MSEARDECAEALPRRLIGWEGLLDRVSGLRPDFISQGFPYESSAPVAAVCFKDCVRTLGAARYALDRYCEVGAEHRAKAAEMSAIFFEVYYLDDVVLRLYSAAEHLANAIIMMRDIDEAMLQDIRSTSRWEKLRRYLKKSDPDGQLTQGMILLRKSAAWSFAMSYRGKWVHNQPPTVAGLGISYRRVPRWQRSPDGRTASLIAGGGDTPEHNSQELAELCIQAFADVLNMVYLAIDQYYALLAEHGIHETDKGLSTTRGASPLS